MKAGGTIRRRNFNPRPPRGGRPEQIAVIAKAAKISIHAPREGGDNRPASLVSSSTPFQSTPPARGATFDGVRIVIARNISIHAPREGGDFASFLLLFSVW